MTTLDTVQPIGSDLAKANLGRMFAPTSVAVLGASDSVGSIGGRTLNNLLEGGFGGVVYPVNTRSAQVAGRQAFPSVRDLPGPIDLAVVSVPIAHVADAIADCIAVGVGGVVLLTAGFAEAGSEGKALEEQLGRTAAAAGIRLCGPNCAGFANADLRVNANFSSHILPKDPSGVALVTQSGGMAGFGLPAALRRGVPIGWFITTGNEVDVAVADALEFVIQAESVTSVIAFMETMRRPDVFLSAAQRAAELGKTLIVLKGARSEEGARAAQTHTASIAGSYESFTDVCEQYGVLVANSLEHMLDIAAMAHSGRRSRGRRVAIMTASGGTGVLATDAASAAGLCVPTLPTHEQTLLTSMIPTPFHGSTENPVDVTGSISRRPEAYGEIIAELGSSDSIDSLAIFLFQTTPAYVDGLLAAARTTDKPFAVISIEEPAAIRAARLPIYPDPARAMAALGALSREPVVRTAATGAWTVDESRRERARVLLAGDGEFLDERAGLGLVEEYGINAVGEHLVTSAQEAAAVVRSLAVPVAMKVRADGLTHKSDVGGVRLNIVSPDQAASAFDDIMAAVKAARPDLQVAGVVVQPMVSATLELVLGVVPDNIFGPLVVMGVGGVLVEILRARVMLRPPFTLEDALTALRRVLDGRLTSHDRGMNTEAQVAFARAACALGDLALELPEVVTLDVNPLVWRGGQLVALDALVQRR
jgi:acyl-CoA synthetase (NDP forming)